MNIRKFALLFPAALAIASCGTEEPEAAVAEGQLYTVSVSADTKAGNVVDDASSCDAFWRIYWEGQLLYCGTSGGSVRLNTDAEYSVFAWANTSPDTGDFDSLLSSTHTWTDSRTDWSSNPLYHSIPLSFSRIGVSAQELDMLDGAQDGSICLSLERTMAKVKFHIEYDDLVLAMFPTETVSGTSYGITVEDVLLGGICQSVGLFDPSYNRRSASSGDITVSQSDEGPLRPVYTVYVPESLGGDILYGNANPLKKSAASLESKGLDPSAYPYLETRITFSSYMSNGTFTRTFRFYIGEDASVNFDVKRNRVYDITLHVGYNGLDISGEWKMDGDTRDDRRSLALDAQDYSVSPGESTVILMDYQWNGGGNVAGSMYLRSNGFALGSAEDRSGWLESGTEPSGLGIRQLDSDHYMLVCKNCMHHYTDMPKLPSARIAWASTRLTVSGTGVYCKWCGEKLFDTSSSSDDRNAFTGSVNPYDATKTKCIAQNESYVEITVPGSCPLGSTYPVYAWTRDGRIQSSADIQVKLSGTPTLVSGRSGYSYVGQRNLISVSDWPIGTYGADPGFTFEITALNPGNQADASTAVLSTTGLTAEQRKRSVYVNCQKSGSYIITLKYDGIAISGLALMGSIAYPSIGYPDGAEVDYGASGVCVYNGGGATRFAKPCFIVSGSGGWVEYTGFDPGLKSTWLGDVAGALADDNGWVSYSDGSPGSVNLSHAYRGGVVSPGNLLPFRTPSTRLDRIRYTATSTNIRTGGIPAFDVPVYFDSKFKDLASVANRTYTEYDADEDHNGSNPSMDFSIRGYWPSPTLEAYDGFYAMRDGVPVNISEVITLRADYMYRFVTSGPVSRSSVMWRLKGTGDDSYSLEICSLAHRKKYIGSIVATCDEHVKKKYYSDFYGGFGEWCDGSTNLYHPLKAVDGSWNVVHYDKTLPAFGIYVSCEHVYKPLFRIQESGVLPTEGPFDPDPSLEGKLPPFFGEFPWVHSSSKAVFYDRARHVYDNANLSYTAMMTRWCSYYTVALLTTAETAGYDMAMYKDSNPPLFRPAATPCTVDGVTWEKTSDDGATAVWNSTDGLQTCEFKYGEWQ